MAEDLAKLVVRLEAETGRYQRELDRANKKLDKFSRGAKKSISGIKTAFSALAIGGTINAVVRATAKQEAALAQLEQGLKSTGQTAGFTKDELVDFASELQKATTFGDEDIINAQANLLTFTNVAGEQFKRTTEAALNLSVRVGQDLKSSVIQLGKALNDPVANLGALSRSGIQFSKDQKDVIKALAETGRLAEAQTMILDELETQYGGSARAARDTFGGALEGLKNAFGDLLESESGLNDSKEAIEEFTALLQDPATQRAADSIASALIASFSGIASAITSATNALSRMKADFTNDSGVFNTVDGYDKEIARLEERLRSLTTTWRKFFADDGTVAGVERNLEKLRQARAALEEFDSPQENFSLPGDDAPAPLPVPGEGKKAEKAQKEAERLEEIRQRELQSVIESLQTEEEALLESYNRRREIILNATELTGEEKKELELRLIDDTLQEIEVKSTKLQKNIKDNAETQSEAFDRIFGSGSLSQLFSDLDNIEQRFKNMLANIAAEALASGIASIFSGGTFGGGVSNFVGGLFGGARAMGGPVTAGTPYLVGERGPELMVPRVSGDVVPNHQLGSAGGGNVSVVAALGDAEITKWLGSKTGEQVVLAHIKRNSSTIRALAST